MPPSAEASRSTTPSQQRKVPVVCPGHTRPLAELQYIHVDQKTLLVSACHDRLPMIRHGQTGDWIGTFAGHKGAVWSCRLDPTGSLAATASGDFSVGLWDAITGQGLGQLLHKHIVKSVDFSPQSQYLATGGHEGLLRIYNLEGLLLNNTSDNDNDNDTESPKNIEAAVKGLQPVASIPMDPNQKIAISKVNWLSNTTLITGCGDGKIRVWEPFSSTATPVHILETGRTEIRDLEVTRVAAGTGPTILTAAAGDRVYFFDLATWTLLKEWPMPIHFRDEGGASLHPSGKFFCAGGSDLWVRVFDFATGEELELNKGHHGPIRCLRYSPTGDVVATGSEDGTIRLWNTD